MQMPPGRSHAKRLVVIIGIQLAIAAVHVLRVGKLLDEPWQRLYYSFASDVLLPFGFYFLLCLNRARLRLLEQPGARALVAFAFPAAAETCQYFGIPALGVTFDPVDYGMYALGVLAAAAVDTLVLSRLFPFWTLAPASDACDTS